MELQMKENLKINGFNKKQTNIVASVELITPEKALNLLRYNKNNRDMKEGHVTFLSNEIKKGLFLENGEPIIFDKFGVLKDGQHRLKAISINAESFFIPIVRGVESSCMATYDTGKNRSASDVLKLNGFKYHSIIAAFTQQINKFVFKKSRGANSYGVTRKETMSNQEVLSFVEENYDWIFPLVQRVDGIIKKTKPRVLSIPFAALIVYMIGGKNPREEVYTFIKHLAGVLKNESSAPLYLYTKLYNSKINKEPLNTYWVLGMSIKAWNYFVDGNPAIKFYKFTIDQNLPKINN